MVVTVGKILADLIYIMTFIYMTFVEEHKGLQTLGKETI